MHLKYQFQSVAFSFRLKTLALSPLMTMRLAALFLKKMFSVTLYSQCSCFIEDEVFHIKRVYDVVRFVSSYVAILRNNFGTAQIRN